MIVSIIIPNLHSPIVGRTLESLRRQTYRGEVEILVVGQDRYGLVQADERVRPIVTPQPVSSAVARNMGIRGSRGQLLAFIDADCVAAPDWLQHLLAPYADPMTCVVGGSVDFPDENYWTVCDNLATFYEFLPGTPAGPRDLLPSLNLSVRAAALAEVGLFDERYPYAAGEDADLTTRLRLRGRELYFEPRARISHHPQRQTLAAALRHAYNFGRFSVKVDPRYRAALRPPFPLRHAWAALLFSGGLAGGVVARVIQRTGLRYWRAWPMVFLAKLAWCWGAARTLRDGSAFAEE